LLTQEFTNIEALLEIFWLAVFDVVMSIAVHTTTPISG